MRDGLVSRAETEIVYDVQGKITDLEVMVDVTTTNGDDTFIYTNM